MTEQDATITISLSINNLAKILEKQCQGYVVVYCESGNSLHISNRFAQSLGYAIDELLPLHVSQWMKFQSDGTVLGKHKQDETETFHCERFTVRTIEAEQPYQVLLLQPWQIEQRSSLLQQFSDTFMKDVNLGVLLINLDFELIDISEMACKILGVQKQEVIHRRMDQVFANVPKEHQLVQRTILDGLVIRNHAISWMNDQTRYELLMDSSLLTDKHGNPVGAYVIFKDVSNLRSLEEQVQRSDRLAMIGQIAAGTAHEIRNPLTSIKGFLQVLNKSMKETHMSKEQEYIDIMLTEINRINGLVSEFLLLSKAKDNVFHKVNPSSVLKEILPIIQNEALLNNVQVIHIPLPQMPEIIADAELLKQVCLNICKNGIEAMGHEGTLTIREKIDKDEKKVYLDIQDTGPGIPSFLIDKIFDPFFTTKEEGIGLGLSVCQRIIHDMGGTIRVKSKGFGTTFTISIPYI